MADGDLFDRKITGPSVSHGGAGATTVLSIATATNRHYALHIMLVAQDDSASDKIAYSGLLSITNDEGTVAVTLTQIQTSGTAWAVSATTSGTNALVQLAAAAGVRSAAIAYGPEVEQNITGA